jgi:hypothetical protein
MGGQTLREAIPLPLTIDTKMTLLCGLRLCCASHLQVCLAPCRLTNRFRLFTIPFLPESLGQLYVPKQKEEGDQVPALGNDE